MFGPYGPYGWKLQLGEIGNEGSVADRSSFLGGPREPVGGVYEGDTGDAAVWVQSGGVSDLGCPGESSLFPLNHAISANAGSAGQG